MRPTAKTAPTGWAANISARSSRRSASRTSSASSATSWTAGPRSASCRCCVATILPTPFVLPPKGERNLPTALAIARIAPEPTGDDISLLVLEADHNVSQHRLQSAFAQVKLEPGWINIATLNPSTRHHLVEVKGFITPEHPELKNMLSGLGSSILSASFLGAYAVPVTLPSPVAAREPAVHVAKPSKT
jgi:hypothetical protein